MRIVGEFPRKVREIETAWIPMTDGVRLAARIWLPEDAEANPVPAILEYVPYRRRDGTRGRDEPMHRYFAGHGYASVRVDIRGSGDSGGLLGDEYLKQEQDDALDVIAWLAAQPWCGGAVGMMGISWGGFNSLQVAARQQPPALKAIITSCSTDDRYADDVHYMGGCPLGDNFSWGATMYGRASAPPDPAVVGDGWRAMWLERLETLPVFLANWLEHQRRDAYWKHGSVRENYGAIRVPVFAIGGWADSYSNAIPRLLAGLTVPCIGVIGPWSHFLGYEGGPGPLIGFLQEALRWWDHWLKGRETGIMQEPMLRVFMQGSDPPAPTYAIRSGRWVAEPLWPPKSGVASRRYALNPGRLDGTALPETTLTLRSPQDTGQAGGEWCAHATGTDLPTDQRWDDAASLVFDTPPLNETVDILGAPVATLDLAVDRPVAMVALRLNDVAPDGASTRVTYGLLNLTHRDGHERPTPLEPGRRYRVRVQLGDIAQTFPAGHRIRLAVSTCYWPIAWPGPAPVNLTLFTGASQLDLPVRAPRPEDAAVAFAPPEAAPPMRKTILEPGRAAQTVNRDIAAATTTVTVDFDMGRIRIEDLDLEYGSWRREIFRVGWDDPIGARGEVTYKFTYRRGDWDVRTETRTVLTHTPTEFVIHADLDAFEGDRRIFTRSVDRRIVRDLT
ncbi:MAG: CocE/NonD family hydrolase [Alphaproteobacteria bacterium]|nr:CocE/NonD family hydrolase [Alphaproteobacteria bacterium]